MDHLLSARALMGISLGFHIIYVAFGIGFPMLLLIAEGLALRTGQEIYHQVARRWVRPVIVLFAIGAVSGTILSFELGFLWPRFMGFSGPMIGLPFWLEGYAFFTEAIFLGLYVYGERRLSRRAQFLTTIPIAIASMFSAFFVISANAWMNTPAGFNLVDGRAVNIQPLQAMLNPAWLHQAIHGTLATYVAAGFAIAGVNAFHLLRGRDNQETRLALTLALGMGVVTVPLMLLSGDFAAVRVAETQPAKLAAMEALYETQPAAPLVLGGWLDQQTGELRFAIEIPYALSILAFRDPNATVTGLAAFPPDERPNANLVHPFFDLMVISFFVMFVAVVWFWVARWRSKQFPKQRLLLWAILLASPAGLLAQEFGWFVTEFGRQPWVAQQVMRVSEGVTPNTEIGWVLLAFLLVYLALTAGLLWLLFHPASLRSSVIQPREAPR